MFFLSLSILSSCSIFIIFKMLAKYRVALMPVIVINYIIATAIGFLFKENDFPFSELASADWFRVSILIGFLFIGMFFLIGYATQKVGITITSISTKMSVVLPMLFSILYYQETLHTSKITGIILALFSIFLVTKKSTAEKFNIRNLLFPLILFIGMGTIDSIVKFNQHENLRATGAIVSSMITFAAAAAIGLIILSINVGEIVKKVKINTFFWGVLLGLTNFGSLYFLIMALNTGFLDSSIIFAVNNTAIILFSVLAGKTFFKEKLSTLNWIGVLTSIIAIVVLSWANFL